MMPKLGIIAGRGLLPFEVANIYAQQEGGCYIAALNDEVDHMLIKDFPHEFFSLGSVGAIIKYFNKHNVKNIIFVGSIDRPNLKSIKVDLTGSILIAKILRQKFLGDDKLLRIVANFFEEKGFKVISAQEILALKPNANDDIWSIKIPSELDKVDIELGVKVSKQLASLDIGQSVIVEDGYVIGIEAAEGTDNLIKRCANLRKKPHGGVLIKMIKCGQDVRMDIPTVGPETISNLASYGYNGIALQINSVIIIEPELTVAIANKHQIFIAKI
jgi:DUF1009 family protein